MAMEMLLLFMVKAVSLIGLIIISKSIFSFFKWVWVFFLRPSKNLKEYGSWAMITGSTDGIGKALAFELASKGLNLVLVGRNPAKLEATSTEIEQNYQQAKIKTIVLDLAKCSGEEIIEVIEKGIQGLDIGVLINNAGLSYPYARYFHEVDLELLESVIKVNLDALTWVTKSVLPVMLKKKKGAIVNIGSGSSGGLCAYPLYTLYAATKAYVAMFNRCISIEYKQQGIDIQCQIPLFVATKMTRIRKSSLLIPSAEEFSKASIRCIGYEKLCIPYWSHSLQSFLSSLLPESMLNRYIHQYFLGMRMRGMKKEPFRNERLHE
ncbi:hypothetical protein ACFE04_024915 [Oxalis oulophora]